jgi:hypothetical protein
MSDIERCYEELRRVIDGGSESMTHEDALATVRLWSEQERVPSPCPHIRSSGTGQWATNWCALAEQPADHREAMRQALEALGYINTHYFVLADHEGPLERAISALRAALAAGALDRLAQANHELNFGENE